MIAGIELGGTKTVVAIGTPDGGVLEEFRFPTTTPEETFTQAIHWLSERGSPEAVGIAAFGPIAVNRASTRYGQVLATPKPDWSGYSLTGAIQQAFPKAVVALDTDVNGAVLAEATLGAGQGLEDLAYITIGTGIGAGILSGGRLIHGALHPEFGHVRPQRMPGDSFPGTCPFHGDCLEGMACGPAVEARWKSPGHHLPPDHPAWETQAWYLAHGILSLLAIVSPARVIVGGGVSQAEGLHEKIEARLDELANGYFPPLNETPYVVSPELGQSAGIIGALLLTAH